MPKKKIITLLTTLTLACGCTVALDSPNQTSTASLKTETFTGYVISIDTVYILVADTPTKKEALSYSEVEAMKFIPNKLLKLPIEKNRNYQLGINSLYLSVQRLNLHLQLQMMLRLKNT